MDAAQSERGKVGGLYKKTVFERDSVEVYNVEVTVLETYVACYRGTFAEVPLGFWREQAATDGCARDSHRRAWNV